MNPGDTNNKQMLVPSPWSGTKEQIIHNELWWIKDIPVSTHCALFQRWPGENGLSLPAGYELYIVSFIEAVDTEWLIDQASKVNAPIIVLSDCNLNDYPLPDNIHYYTYYWWHNYIELIKQWFPHNDCQKNIKYKASAFCNRITQSKLIIFTALMENFKSTDLLVKLDDWLEEKYVH